VECGLLREVIERHITCDGRKELDNVLDLNFISSGKHTIFDRKFSTNGFISNGKCSTVSDGKFSTPFFPVENIPPLIKRNSKMFHHTVENIPMTKIAQRIF
jgi:hypothetical protein